MEARESAEHGLRSSSRPAPKGAAPLDPKDPSYPPKIREVLAKGQTTWLKNTEVCDLLLNFQAYNMRVSRDPPLQPPGGSLFLYDRRAVRFFRKDRHNWRKKADGKTVRETHEKLKVGNVDMLNCYYAHADQDDSLQRRCYWLLESDEDIVLVHYLNVEPFDDQNPAMQRMQRAPSDTLLGLDPILPGWDELAPGHSMEAALPLGLDWRGGSFLKDETAFPAMQQQPGEYVSPFARAPTPGESGRASPASAMDQDGNGEDEDGAAEIKAKHQAFKTSKALALEQELCNLDRQVMEQLMSRRPTPGMATNPHMALVDEQVRAWENQINELESSSAQIAPMRVEARPGMIVEQLSGDLKHSSEDSADPAGRQSPSQSSQDDMAVPVRSTGRAHDRMEDTASRAQNPLEAQGSVSRRAFELLDYTPDWDFCVGGAKMIISGAMQEENNMQDGAAQLFVSFDGQEVPAKILGPGVLRCHVPPHEPGSIKVVVTRGDGKPCSKSFAFEYRLLPRSARGNEERTVDALSDRDLQGRLINMLLGSRRAATGTTSDAGTSSHTSANTASGKAGASSDGSRERQRASGTGDAALDQQVDDMEHLDEEKRERLLMTLLEREMKRFIAEVLKQKDAAQKQSAGTGRSDRSVELLVNQLSPAGVALLHYCAALGFDWAVLMLLSVGANIALKDAWGYQPLHWAAARGQEATVAMLVARNAQPTAMTFPTESQPALTAADLASQNGHSGIAAYLAEVALNQSLQKMHMATSTDSQAGSGAPSADGTGRAVITMQRKRSRHHDYLDDVLGSPFGAKPSMSAESAGSQRGQPEAGPEASSGKQPDELDATAVAAAAKKAAEMIQAANRRFAQRRTVRDTRRQRLQKREDAALARIQDSVKTWTDVQTIADTQVLSDTRQPPDPLLLRYLHLGKRITRLNTTLRCTLQAPASGGSDSEKKEAENEHEEVSDGRRGHSGELEDYGSDTDVQMCRSNSLLTMHQARRALRSGRGGGIGGARPERRPRRPASAALPHIPTSPDMDTHVAVHHVEGIVRSPAARAQYLRLKEATSHLAFIVDCRPFYIAGFNAHDLVAKSLITPQTHETEGNKTGRMIIRELFAKAAAANLNVVRTCAHTTNPHHPLQASPGMYNEDVFEGLDFIVEEARLHGLRVIISFADNWKLAGGVDEFVDWSNTAPKRTRMRPSDEVGDADFTVQDDATQEYEVRRHALFFSDQDSREMYKDHVRAVVERRNTINKRVYRDDPTIMAWGLLNEPRCESWKVDGCEEHLQAWIEEMSAYVKGLDPHHLVTIGEEGFWAEDVPQAASNPADWAGQTGQNFTINHMPATIDFATVHVWPDQWQQESAEFHVKWLTAHMKDAEYVLGKPLLVEEFGKKLMGQDKVGTGFSASAIEKLRNPVFKTTHAVVEAALRSGRALQGSLFWRWDVAVYKGAGQADYGVRTIDSTFDLVTSHASLIKRHMLNAAPDASCRLGCWVGEVTQSADGIGIDRRCSREASVCEALQASRPNRTPTSTSNVGLSVKEDAPQVFTDETTCCQAGLGAFRQGCANNVL
ncbi:hypothetical protein WJX72_009412 [[Myrmecia] bisecta]|uniref:CG-1 domain-containing protein n=1 Tax=[Myrmecia] bisecta TaxID=41462 RepID=A0AAW1QG21_9CHLO